MKDYQCSRSMMGEQAADYTKALTEAETLDELRALVIAYAELAVDAMPVVAGMSEADFADWRKGLKAERRGRFAGEAFAVKFGAVLMPLPMMRISQIAAQYKAPFGVTWARCRELRPDLLKVEEPPTP